MKENDKDAYNELLQRLGKNQQDIRDKSRRKKEAQQNSPQRSRSRSRDREEDSDNPDVLSSRELDDLGYDFTGNMSDLNSFGPDVFDQYPYEAQAADPYPSAEFNVDFEDFDFDDIDKSFGGKVRSTTKRRFKQKSNKQKNNKKKGIRRKSNKRKYQKKSVRIKTIKRQKRIRKS